MSAIARSANSVEKMQVFWPWSSLRMSACTVPRTLASTQARTSSGSSSGRFAISWSIAAHRNMASTAGAGPLMVIDTDVVGEHRSNPSNRARMSSSVAIDTPDVPTLP
jgi:hypothetical protein